MSQTCHAEMGMQFAYFNRIRRALHSIVTSNFAIHKAGGGIIHRNFEPDLKDAQRKARRQRRPKLATGR